MIHRTLLFVGLALGSLLACTCRHAPSEISKETPVTQPAPPPSTPSSPDPTGPACAASLQVAAAGDDGTRLVATFRNAGPSALFVLSSERMPYVVVEAPDRIVLAWSIQPIPDDLDVGAIEPLATVELPAGGVLTREATLRAPLQVSSHLRSPGPYRGTLPATVNVVAELGHIDHALDPRERHRQNYNTLVAAQRTCRSAPVTVSLATP